MLAYRSSVDWLLTTSQLVTTPTLAMTQHRDSDHDVI